MATYGYTVGDALPYPTNVNEAANMPPVLLDRANAMQLALNKRVPGTRKITAGNGLTQSRADLAADMTIDITIGNGLAINADGIDVNWALLNQTYAYASHSHAGVYQPVGNYSVAGHTHPEITAHSIGINVDRVAVGTLNAGQEKTVSGSKASNEMVLVSVSHVSSWICAVVSAMTASSYSIEVRNMTASTNHTGVYVNVLKVRDT